ncbi:glycine oxidase ThiO [Acidithiobacillus sp. AMEEHan]|uniref:glycine oxidase ThiO n=1 Tax=Acidithiobacillus sp. AMEEHan TaxID=2994951 RepID=UPI0027E59C23|nr:glycine oxidase ThiO [Acidithiobacillus sp. AMEEHan]
MRPADILIIGAGVIGLSAALRLAQAGRKVTVLDRGNLGAEASWAGGGILSPLHAWRYRTPLLRLADEGMRRYQEFANEIKDASGIDPEWQMSGMWILDSKEAPLPSDVLAWGAAWGRDWQWHTATQMQQLAPMLRADAALFCPEVAQIRNPRLLSGLIRYVMAVGVHTRDHAEVTEIRKTGAHWVVTADNLQFRSERIIISAGSWTGKVLAELGISLPVRPVRGQMLLLQGQENALPQIVLQGGHYLVQRRDGQLLVGSTNEEVGFDKSCTPEATHELLAFAHRVFPASRSYPVTRQWAGLRPGSPDNIPFISKVPGQDGMFIASGHFRYGLTTAPITAELLADLVLDRAPRLDLAPYALPFTVKE